MHAKITVNRKTTRNIFKYFLKSLQNDPEGPTYSGPFTSIYLHLKPTPAFFGLSVSNCTV